MQPIVMGRSGRIELRRVEREDLPLYRRVLLENEEWLRPWSPSPMPNPQDNDAMLRGIDGAIEEWRNDRAYRAGIFENGHIIGRISLSNISRGNFQNAYSGYWIAAGQAGKGIMPEAIVLALSFAFGPLTLHRVQYAIMPHNAASLRVMEKMAIRKEGLAKNYLQIDGIWQNHFLFAITREEWHEREAELREAFVRSE